MKKFAFVFQIVGTPDIINPMQLKYGETKVIEYGENLEACRIAAEKRLNKSLVNYTGKILSEKEIK